MALSLSDVTSFLFFFTVLLVADAAWLLILWRIGYIQLDGNGKFPKKTFQQWVVSDALLAATSGILFWLDLTRPGFDVFLSAVVITVAAIVAAALDYLLCKDYYFPPVRSAVSSVIP